MTPPTFNYEAIGRVELPATEIVQLAAKCYKDMTEDYCKRHEALSNAGRDDDDETFEIVENLQAGGSVGGALDPRYTTNTKDYPGESLRRTFT